MRALGIIFPWLLPAVLRAEEPKHAYGEAPPVEDGRIGGGMTLPEFVVACADLQKRVDVLEKRVDETETALLEFVSAFRGE